ncbi:MAG TPA: MerR family transcriptional regulator [Spirochaetia bacterium]|nr:MerR family transcriptional regulator [Spirochaetia bacterium]
MDFNLHVRTEGENMIKIGDFSNLTKVSIKALRHYDKLNLLVPARVDVTTGYRYYSVDQITRLNRILASSSKNYPLSRRWPV